MAQYLYQAAYTSESWATQVGKRENVMDRVGPLAASLGGKLQEVWYAFGEYDVVGIIDMPSPEAAAAFALAVAKGGSVKAARTTPLLSVEQGIEAMRQADQAGGKYRPPVGG